MKFDIRVVWEDYNTAIYTVTAPTVDDAINRIYVAISDDRVLRVMEDQGHNVGY